MEPQNNNISELESLRVQMAEFKQQLNQQEIVNDRLLAESMKKKMSWIKNYFIFELAILPVLFITWLGLREIMHLSWWNVCFLITLCSIDVLADYHINLHSLKTADYLHCNLIATVEKLVRMKHQRALQMAISIPMVVIWLLWAGIEVYNGLDFATCDFQSGFLKGGLVGGAIGGVAGLIFAFKVYHKMQKINDDIISQIKELTDAE